MMTAEQTAALAHDFARRVRAADLASVRDVLLVQDLADTTGRALSPPARFSIMPGPPPRRDGDDEHRRIELLRAGVLANIEAAVRGCPLVPFVHLKGPLYPVVVTGMTLEIVTGRKPQAGRQSLMPPVRSSRDGEG